MRCIEVPFFEAFYFIITTLGTVGFGDILPSYTISRAIVVVIILVSLVVIPAQIQKVVVHVYLDSTELVSCTL